MWHSAASWQIFGAQVTRKSQLTLLHGRPGMGPIQQSPQKLQELWPGLLGHLYTRRNCSLLEE